MSYALESMVMRHEDQLQEIQDRLNKMENQNKTPETDSNAECEQEDGSPFAPVREWVHADFARRMEQQRNEARKDRDEAWELLKRISRKGEFMDREGLRLLVGDWLAYRGISVRSLSLKWEKTDGGHDYSQCGKMVEVANSLENSQADRPNV